MQDDQSRNLTPAVRLFKLAGDATSKDLTANDGDLPAWLVAAKRRQRFEKMAMFAARQGENHLLLSAPPLPAEHLIAEGFIVRELVRRDALLKSLELAAESALNRATSSAGNFIFENPSFRLRKSDDLIHRNILYSLLHFLWNQEDLTEETSTLDFEEKLKEYSNASEDLILQNRFLLKSIVDDFKSFKMAQSQAEAITEDLTDLPPGRDRAWIISWSQARWTSTPENIFSPQLLNWYSSNWSDLFRYINETMHSHAKMGCSGSTFIITLDRGKFLFEDWSDYENIFGVNPFPWQLLWHELIISGFTPSAAVFRSDDNMAKKVAQMVDSTYNFDFYRHDKLVLHVGWNGF